MDDLIVLCESVNQPFFHREPGLLLNLGSQQPF